MNGAFRHLDVGRFARFKGFFRPKLAATLDLCRAGLECEHAVKANAQFFAPQVLQEATILLQCGKEELHRSRYLNARLLAALSQRKAKEAIEISEKNKCEQRKEIRRQLNYLFMNLSELKNVIRHGSEDSSTPVERQFQQAFADFLEASQYLRNDDIPSANAHLEYSRALMECVRKKLNNPRATNSGRSEGQRVINDFAHRPTAMATVGL
jgi:hypothetical protein